MRLDAPAAELIGSSTGTPPTPIDGTHRAWWSQQMCDASDNVKAAHKVRIDDPAKVCRGDRDVDGEQDDRG
jgi:hypothetical protein